MPLSRVGDGMRVRLLLVVAALTVPSFAAAPPCAGDVEIGDAHIMRIEKNGVLVMNDGRALKLEGIRLPAGVADHAPQAIADRAFGEVERLAKGVQVDARATWPKEDRYDRVRSQIFTRDGLWLQLDLLQKGLARVEFSPDRGECNRELLAAEAEARRTGQGLWADPAYGVRAPDQLAGLAGSFQVVSGRVLQAVLQNGALYLNFGPDWRTDFTVILGADDVKRFKALGVDPEGYEGKIVRVRGVLQMLNGPAIGVGNPKQIEVLQ
jgi:micrococcal nuclease